MKPAAEKTLEDRKRGQRIAHLRKIMDLDQDGLAALMGVTRGAVGNWEHGGGISRSNLEKMRSLTGVDYLWLTKAEGHTPQSVNDLRLGLSALKAIPKNKGFPISEDREGNLTVHRDSQYESALDSAIPEVLVNAGAGGGGYSDVQAAGRAMLDGDCVKGEYVFPSYFLQELTFADADWLHIIFVKGDSMYDTLKSGDRIIVDTSDKTIGDGGIFVLIDLAFQAEVIVKRVRRVSVGGKLRLEIISDNANGESPRIVDPREVSVIGKVIARITAVS